MLGGVWSVWAVECENRWGEVEIFAVSAESAAGALWHVSNNKLALILRIERIPDRMPQFCQRRIEGHVSHEFKTAGSLGYQWPTGCDE